MTELTEHQREAVDRLHPTRRGAPPGSPTQRAAIRAAIRATIAAVATAVRRCEEQLQAAGWHRLTQPEQADLADAQARLTRLASR